MSSHDREQTKHGSAEHETPEVFDSEIRFGATLNFGITLLLITAVAAAGMWVLNKAMEARAVARDTTPSPLVQKGQQKLPPEPRLQANPDRELVAMEAEERELVESYAWVDRDHGVARIPVEHAMDLVAAMNGVPAAALGIEAAGDADTEPTGASNDSGEGP